MTKLLKTLIVTATFAVLTVGITSIVCLDQAYANSGNVIGGHKAN